MQRKTAAALDLLTLTEVWGYDTEVPYLLWARRRGGALRSADRAWVRMVRRLRLVGVPVVITSTNRHGGGKGGSRSLMLPASARRIVEGLIAWYDHLIGAA